MRLAALGLALCLAGCAAPSASPSFLPPKPEAAAAPAKAMQGIWAPKEEAKPGPLRLEDCFPAYTSYEFEPSLNGARLSSTWHSQGAYMPDDHFYEGVWRDGKLQLQETPNVMGNYLHTAAGFCWLRWDEGAQQWIGQLDSEPLRLARLILNPPENCGAPPP